MNGTATGYKQKIPGLRPGLCGLAGIQTPNLLIRSQMLYSIELRVLFGVPCKFGSANVNNIFTSPNNGLAVRIKKSYFDRLLKKELNGMAKKLAGIVLLMSLSLASIAQTTSTKDKKWSSARPDIPGTFTVEIGVNRGLSAPSKFKTGFWGSRTINLYYQYDIRILNSRFSFVPGIGLSMERYKFTNGYTLKYPSGTTDSVYMRSPSQASITGMQKSQLITNYLEVPLELKYSSRPDDPSRSFKASIGGRIGVLYDAFTKVKYKENGEVKQFKDKQRFNLNQIRYGVTAKVGIGNFAVFTYYNLSPLFQKDKGLRDGQDFSNFSTVTVGVSLASF